MNHFDLVIQIMIHHYKLMIQVIQDFQKVSLWASGPLGLHAMSPNPNSAAGSIRSQPCFYPHYIEYIPLFSLGYALGLLCSFTQPILQLL